MYVMVFTRWEGGTLEEMTAAARAAKPYFEKNGAEWFRLSKFHTGEWTGQWLVAARYPNWAVYGEVQDALAEDAEYQKTFARVCEISHMMGRSIAVGVDL